MKNIIQTLRQNSLNRSNAMKYDGSHKSWLQSLSSSIMPLSDLVDYYESIGDDISKAMVYGKLNSMLNKLNADQVQYALAEFSRYDLVISTEDGRGMSAENGNILIKEK